MIYIGLDNVCYPETLGKMLVINAPYLAVQTWSIIKRFFDPRTLEKIEVRTY
jgi:CRAL/TRIO domain